MIKRIISGLLSLCLVFTLAPSLKAVETPPSEKDTAISFSNGTGTESDPFQITTAQQLNEVRNNLSAHFVLTKDIDLSVFSSEGWTPIGTKEEPFTGTLDGAGHTIRNLHLLEGGDTAPAEGALDGSKTWIGLFGYAINASIQNVNLEIASCNAKGASRIYLGGLVGYDISSYINNVWVSGADLIASPGTGYWAYHNSVVGGIVGYADGTQIIDAHNYCNLFSKGSLYTFYAGGITGYGGIIVCASNSGNITSQGSNCDGYIGGISGYNADISECYNTGSLSIPSGSSYHDRNAGGIAGYGGTVENCYNLGDISSLDVAVGIASENTNINNCYSAGKINNETLYYISSVGETSAHEMEIQSSYSGFDFETTWMMPSNTSYSYPILRNNTQITGDGDNSEVEPPPTEEDGNDTTIPADAVEYNGHFYKVYDYSLSWTDANTACAEMGGYLATLTSVDEEKFVYDLLKNGAKNYYWLGGSDEKQEGVWEWITGEDWNYTHWFSGQPDNHSDHTGEPENYLVIARANMGWNDLPNTGDTYGSSELKNSGYICEWETIDSGSTISDNYIVERVKEYTSDVLYEAYRNINNSSDSSETKYQKLVELFKFYGFLDPLEGVSYCRDITPEYQSYLALTNNEVYSAWQQYNFLNRTISGQIVNAALTASGLVYNFEIKEWLNPFTYVGVNDFPGVAKYKDMLYDFMGDTDEELEVIQCISTISKFSEYMTEDGKRYAEELINQLNNRNGRTIAEVFESEVSKRFFEDVNIVTDKDGNFVLDESSGFGQFSKAMGLAEKSIDIGKLSVDFMKDMVELDAKLAHYAQYYDFLMDLASNPEIPWEMSLAAYGILQEIEEGEFGRVIAFATDLIGTTEVTDVLTDYFLSIALGKVGAKALSEILLVADITAFCVNCVVDVGAITRGVDYAEGYALLSEYYAKKLEASKKAFNEAPTVANAWNFYEIYNLLYRLRYKGEIANLKANKVEGIAAIFFEHGYDVKEEMVNDTLAILESCKFTMEDPIELPESVQYAAKSVISCPVNVEIYAPDGSLIATLIDGIECDFTNEYGRFAVLYRTYTGDYAKVICLKEDGNYKIKIIGVDGGLVDFEFACVTGNDISAYEFKNVEIGGNDVFLTSVNQLTSAGTYSIDADGDDIFESVGTVSNITNNSYQAVTNISLNKNSLVLAKGESEVLNVFISPATASRKNVSWVSSDNDVVTVTDGKITAKAVGEAIVYCISQDSIELAAICKVTVEESAIRIPVTDILLNLNSMTLSEAGETETLIAAVSPSNATDKTVSWHSDNPGVATVSNAGVITAVSNGTAIITATTKDGGFTATCTVAVRISSEPDDEGSEDGNHGGTPQPALVYTITFDANGGYINISSALTGESGKLSSLPTPNRDGYTFNGWYTAASGGSRVTTDTVFNVDTTVYAQWSKIDSSSGSSSGGTSTGGGSGSANYSVTVSTGVENGSITALPARAEKGDTVTIIATPNEGYEVGEIIVTDRNGREITVRNEGGNRYTFTMPSSLVKVSATFVQVEESTPQIIFQDVTADTYYYDAVLWAVEHGITTGVTATTFNPNGVCTRAQIVAFLWRANGSPVPQTGVNPFTDVSPDAYYYDAVLWAVEEGITSGTTATSFSPNSGCTRAQAATFLWRSVGFPADTSSSSFTDVADNAYYADAVKWAVANGVTLGTTASTFSPHSGCTRAQIVTFLYRAIA